MYCYDTFRLPKLDSNVKYQVYSGLGRWPVAPVALAPVDDAWGAWGGYMDWPSDPPPPSVVNRINQDPKNPTCKVTELLHCNKFKVI